MTRKRRVAVISILILISGAFICSTVLLALHIKNIYYNDYRVLAYVTDWSVKGADLNDYAFQNVTDVCYAFAHVGDDLLPELSADSSRELKRLSVYLKKHYPDVNLLLSIGGGGAGDDFCDMSRTKSARAAFINKLAAMQDEYGLAGFDIDWEYPGLSNAANMKYCDNCTNDHAALIADMRAVLGKGTILAMAISGGRWCVSRLDNKKLAKNLDYVNVMNYDFSRTNQADFGTGKSAMLNCYFSGYKKRQLLFGVPFYSRSENVAYDSCSYGEIMDKIDAGEGKLKQNNNCSYALFGNDIASIDTDAMIKKKMKWVKSHGYGGGFCWHLSCDRNGELISVIGNELKNNGTANIR